VPSQIDMMWDAVERDPEDWTAKGALADLLDERGERGDPEAALGLRWCLKRHKHPFALSGRHRWFTVGGREHEAACLGPIWHELPVPASKDFASLFRSVGFVVLKWRALIEL
jgi:hypothetical protein